MAFIKNDHGSSIIRFRMKSNSRWLRRHPGKTLSDRRGTSNVIFGDTMQSSLLVHRIMHTYLHKTKGF